MFTLCPLPPAATSSNQQQPATASNNLITVFFSLWWHHWWFEVERLGALNAYAKTLPDTGPYNSVQLGMLKQLDQMVNDLEKKSGAQAHLTLQLGSKAMAALPEDTAELLRACKKNALTYYIDIRSNILYISMYVQRIYMCYVNCILLYG